MSDQGFERLVGEKLRATAAFVYHPPDDMKTKQWKPGDFIFGIEDRWGVIECKEVHGETFALSKWTPQQRLHAKAVTEAGGNYWLLVRFQPSGVVVAYMHHEDMPERGSLKPGDGVHLPLRPFNVLPLLL